MRNHHAMYLYSMLIPEWPTSFYKAGSKGYWSRRSFGVRPSRCAYRCSDKRPALSLSLPRLPLQSAAASLLFEESFHEAIQRGIYSPARRAQSSARLITARVCSQIKRRRGCLAQRKRVILHMPLGEAENHHLGRTLALHRASVTHTGSLPCHTDIESRAPGAC